MADEVPLEDFLVYSSVRTAYKNDNMPHVKLAKRLAERDEESAPKPGQRFAWLVITDPTKGKEMSARTEVPDHARKHGLRPDRLFYVSKQLRDTIVAWFECIGLGDEANGLFDDCAKKLYYQEWATQQKEAKAALFAGKSKAVVPSKPPTAKRRKLVDNKKITSFFCPVQK